VLAAGMVFGAAVGSGHTQLGAWDHQTGGTAGVPIS